MAVLLVGITHANAGMEIPSQGTVQSGIGLVSGWHCDADQIAVSFNGGPLIEASYGSTRNDTVNACGDSDNGFALLWNYNLLGSGSHSVALYADGRKVSTTAFRVTTLGAEFLTNKQSNRRIYGFPDLDHDVILEWQQGNQNYVVSDYVDSINSYNISGIWETYANGQVDGVLSMHVSPSNSNPEFAEIVIVGINGSLKGTFFAGAMQKNEAIVGTDEDLGATVTALLGLEFTGHRSGRIELLECSPAFRCQSLGIPIGLSQPLVKQYPFPENASLPQSVDDTDDPRFESDSFEDSFYRIHSDRIDALKDIIEETENPPLKSIGKQ